MSNSRWSIFVNDCLHALPKLPADSIDAIVTDPPYGLEFMGKEWDAPWKHGFSSPGYGDAERLVRPSFTSSRNPICQTCGKRQRTWKDGPAACSCASPQWDRKQADEMRAFQAWCEAWATEALRVAKPGAHLLAFGGTRTYHRLTCALEDAGWEIRDSLCWLYGSGFPKSKNLDGKWQGWGTALKPAFEPIVLARKPLVGTVAANVEKHGVGALNINGCRIGDFANTQPSGMDRFNAANAALGYRPGEYAQGEYAPPAARGVSGRWPANVLLDEEAGAMLDAQTGVLTSGVMRAGQRRKATLGKGGYNDGMPDEATRADTYGDSGGASRFFYCAKASPAERNAGIEGKNTHPTVKPLTLMRYLVRLVTPPGGVLLDLFTGSGTTACACMYEQVTFLGIEQDATSAQLAAQRIAYHEREAAK